MKIKKDTIINASIESVWNSFAHNFVAIDEWSSEVSSSVEKEGVAVEGAPCLGRVCSLSSGPKGLLYDEEIVSFDDESHQLSFVVTTIGKSSIPVVSTLVHVSLESIDQNTTKLNWHADAELTNFGKILSPLLRMGMGSVFAKLLGEFKTFVENKDN